MRKRSELFFSLILLPIDFIAILSAFVLAYIIRVKLDGRPVAYPISAVLFFKVALVILPVWILIFALSGLYNLSSLRGRLAELGKVFIAVSGGTMFLILVDFFSKQPLFPSKSIPIYGYAISLVLVVFCRQILRMVQRQLFGLGIGVHQALMIGSGKIAQRIAADLKDASRSGYRVVGVVDTAQNAAKRMAGLPIYSSFAEASNALGKRGIDEIIQADSALEPEEVMEMVSYASNHHLSYRFIPNQFGLFASNAALTTLAGLPMVEIRHTPLEGWGRIVKRVFDLAGATFGLVVGSPIFLAVAVAIKLGDPGPVFYRHKRLSRAGRPVYVYKFRTMRQKYCDGDAYGRTVEDILLNDFKRPDLLEEFNRNQKLENDPRVSVVGRFLRRTSLDEIPQLLNVFKGDMSMVGPRPIVTAELDRYGEGQATFLALKPGITGLWQISGRSDIGYEDRVKLDIYYVENWSLWLDIKILIKTIISVLRGRGAY